MNASKTEQRVLHVLARGGVIALIRDDAGKLLDVECWTREGWRLSPFDQNLFRRLKSKRLIGSVEGQPYRITRLGLLMVRSRLDNR